MKKQAFSIKLYLDMLKQLRLAGLILLVICIVVTLLPFLFTAVGGHTIASTPEPLAIAPALLVYMFIAPVLFVFIAFSFLFRRSSSDFYHSLPLTRLSLYLSTAAAVFTWLLGTIVFTILTAFALYSLWGYAGALYLYPLMALAFGVGSLLVMACALIGVSATGTRFSAFILGGVILFLPRFITFICSMIIESTSPMLISADLGILFNDSLNLPVYMFIYMGRSGFGSYVPDLQASFTSLPTLLYTFILALSYTALGALVFHKRKSETAGKSAPNAAMQHVYRCLITAPILVFIGAFTALRPSLYLDGNVIVVLIVAAVLVYFIYELVTTKRFANLKKALYVFPLCCAVCLGITYGAYVYGRSEMAQIPNADEIRAVRVDTRSSGDLPDYGSLLVGEITFDNRELIDLVQESLSYSYAFHTNTAENVNSYITQNLIIELTNGRSIARQVIIPGYLAADYNRLLRNSSPYSQAVRTIPPDDEITSTSFYGYGFISMNDSDFSALWQIFRQELEALSDEDFAQIYSTYAHNYGSYNAVIDTSTPEMPQIVYLNYAAEISGIRNGKRFVSRYSITDKTPKTAQALMQLSNANDEEALATVKEHIASRNFTWLSVDLNLINISKDSISLNGNSYYTSISNMNGEMYEHGGSIMLSYADTLRLANLLLESRTQEPDLSGHLVNFSFNIDYESPNSSGTYYSSTQNIFGNLSDAQLDILLEILEKGSIQDSYPATAISEMA